MIKVGLYFDGAQQFSKYSGVLNLFKLLETDKRFLVVYICRKKELIPEPFRKKVRLFSSYHVKGRSALDYVFTISPYNSSTKDMQTWTSKIILCQYGTYGICPGCDDFSNIMDIYKFMYKCICDSNDFKQTLINNGVPEEKIFVGKPTYDYPQYYKKENKRTTILWTPHHSIEPNKYIKTHYSMLKEYGKLFEDELPRMFPNVDFVIKLHPWTKNALKSELSNLIAWKNRCLLNKNVKFLDWQNANYYDAFINSDGILNDSISFIFEYLPTLNPMCVLYSDGSQYTKFATDLINNGYYIAKNKDGIIKFINTVIEKKDNKKQYRREFLKHFVSQNQTNSEKIRDMLINEKN